MCGSTFAPPVLVKDARRGSRPTPFLFAGLGPFALPLSGCVGEGSGPSDGNGSANGTGRTGAGGDAACVDPCSCTNPARGNGTGGPVPGGPSCDARTVAEWDALKSSLVAVLDEYARAARSCLHSCWRSSAQASD